MSVAQVRGNPRREIAKCWRLDEPAGETTPPPIVRTAFDRLLDVCGVLEDPEFHDGWQPVRARSADPKSE
jgi:hypothetical protein